MGPGLRRHALPRRLALFALGALFAGGLVLGGMADPRNIVGFLDVAGAWNPRLLFMMGGAVALYGAGYRLIVRQRAPLFGGHFPGSPSSQWREPRLLLGASLFGVGWALCGYCPGPAWVATGSGSVTPLLVLVGTLLGIALVEARSARIHRAHGPHRDKS